MTKQHFLETRSIDKILIKSFISVVDVSDLTILTDNQFLQLMSDCYQLSISDTMLVCINF